MHDAKIINKFEDIKLHNIYIDGNDPSQGYVWMKYSGEY